MWISFDLILIIGIGTTASALDEDGVLDIDTTISLETTWHAMEETVSMGLVRSIGIRLMRCNCHFYHLLSPFQNNCLHFYFSLYKINVHFQKYPLSDSTLNYKMEKFIAPCIIKGKIVIYFIIKM